MRRFLVSTMLCSVIASQSVLAADLPAVAPPPPPPVLVPPFVWTGCYIGAAAGYNWGRSQSIYTDRRQVFAPIGTPYTRTYNLEGAVAGGTVGCNYQFNYLVVGAESDFSWTNKSGATPTRSPPFAPFETTSIHERWVETSRLRAGLALDRALFYVTGGAAIADFQYTVCDYSVPSCVKKSDTPVGYSFGGGIEYAVWQGLSLKAEYIHSDFGKTTFQGAMSGWPPGTKVSLSDDMIRGGINYRFDLFNLTAPAAARY